jgi:hypothetical protein
MPEGSSDAQATEMSRRELPGRGAALVGAAVAGVALPPSIAAAQTHANITVPDKRLDIKGAKPSALPNFDQ